MVKRFEQYLKVSSEGTHPSLLRTYKYLLDVDEFTITKLSSYQPTEHSLASDKSSIYFLINLLWHKLSAVAYPNPQFIFKMSDKKGSVSWLRTAGLAVTDSFPLQSAGQSLAEGWTKEQGQKGWGK